MYGSHPGETRRQTAETQVGEKKGAPATAEIQMGDKKGNKKGDKKEDKAWTQGGNGRHSTYRDRKGKKITNSNRGINIFIILYLI